MLRFDLFLLLLVGCAHQEPKLVPEAKIFFPVSPQQKTCDLVVFKYTEGTTENPMDGDVLKTATKRCGELYKDAPCVKVIVKKKGPHYNVYCGEVMK